MTLVSTANRVFWPGHWTSTAGTIGVSGSTTVAAGQYQAYIFQASEDMTIAYVGTRFTGAVGSPTANVAIYTVDTSTGLASADWNTTSTDVRNGAGAIAASNFYVTTLANSATITRGQYFAVRYAHSGGTNFSVSRITNTNNNTVNNAFPYQDVNGTKTALTGIICMSLSSGNATGFYSFPHLSPVATSSTPTLTTFSTTDGAGTERGLRFQVPFQCRCIGLRHHQGTATGNFNAILRSDAFAELSSSSTLVEGLVALPTASVFANNYFDNAVQLEPGTWYRLGLQPTTTTVISLATIQVQAAAYMAAIPGGTNQHYFTYTTAGAPAIDTATDTYVLLDLILDQVNASAGTGGGMIG